MIRALFLAVLFATGLSAAAPAGIHTAEIPAPGTGGFSTISVGPDGRAWLTWLEKADATTTLQVSTLDRGAGQWSPAQTLASGADLFVNFADFPAITAGPEGRATVVWFVSNPVDPAGHSAGHHGSGYRAFYRQTSDRGQTWTAPALLTQESDSVEFVSLATLADDRVLAVWLDGRAKKSGHAAAPASPEAPQQLYARILGSTGPDRLVDGAVCDCCQTSLAAFPDGSALVAYRGRTAGEVRDIMLARFNGVGWAAPRTLHADNWQIAGCPVNGPQLASDGGRVAVTWFTAQNSDPRVLATTSPDAGARFLSPLRLEDARPAGRVDTLLLHDGAMLATWVDVDGVLWLRRITPDFTPTPPVRLSAAEHGRIKGFPRMALRLDYVGGNAPAEVLVTFTAENAPTLRTLRVIVPEADLLEADKNCDCAPADEELRGYAIRGTILEAQAQRGLIRVKNEAVPGFFAAGSRDFHVGPELFQRIAIPGRNFIGRFSPDGETPELFDVRLIAPAPQK